MSAVEFVKRFSAPRLENGETRSPAIVVIEFGGGSCNKAGAPSCKDFCAVPNGIHYNPLLDPSIKMIKDLFPEVNHLKPSVVSIVPNGESIDTNQKSNTLWAEVFKLQQNNEITQRQFEALKDRFFKSQGLPLQEDTKEKMNLAEKMALVIALGKNAGLNISATTNGSFLTKDLLKLYGKMGLQTINLSYHPNSPFDPNKHNPDLEHLINRAKDAVAVDIVPTITHVLTSQNVLTFIALADYVTDRDIFFSVGIANARGGGFSTGEENKWIEPTDVQLKMIFLRLLARKLFADRSIRTTIPYLLIAPYLSKSWICDQTTDFFHISIDRINGKLKPNLNVCSEVRPNRGAQVIDFIKKGKLDTASYLKWREKTMKDSETGCKTCIHQCFFESEARGGISLNNPLLPVEAWDYLDTLGKGLRQRHTFKKPIRPVVSVKKDFESPYLWESLLQGVSRLIAKLSADKYWQETFSRSHVSYSNILATCFADAFNKDLISQLVQAEKNDIQIKNWHEERDIQSKLVRNVYLRMQKSGKEAGMALPLKFKGILNHDSGSNLSREIEEIILYKKTKQEKPSIADSGSIYPLIVRLIQNLLRYYFTPRFFSSWAKV